MNGPTGPGQRPAEPGERCTCGRPAVLVFTGGPHGDTGYCGTPDGGDRSAPCPSCDGDRHEGRCPAYRVNGIERTPTRVHALRACQRGGVQRSPTPVPSLSPWVLDGVRLLVGSPDAVALDELARRALTHEGDSQTITAAGAALLREWSR